MPHFRVSSALGSTITTTIIWQFNTPTWSIFIHSLCALLHIEILCINFFLPLFCAQRFHQWLVIELTTLSNYAFYCPPPLCQPFFEKKCSLSFAPSSPPKKKRVHNCLIFFFFLGRVPVLFASHVAGEPANQWRVPLPQVKRSCRASCPLLSITQSQHIKRWLRHLGATHSYAKKERGCQRKTKRLVKWQTGRHRHRSDCTGDSAASTLEKNNKELCFVQ